MFKALLLSLSLLGLSLTAHSQDDDAKDYIVELILFKHLEHTNEESWLNTLELSYPESLTYLYDGKTATPAGQPRLLVINNSKNQDSIEKRLQSSRDFRPLWHKTWKQRIGSEANASNIVIQGGEPIDGVYPIAGTIKLFKSRYLHLRSNLWFVDFHQDITSLSTFPYPQTLAPTEMHKAEDGLTTLTTDGTNLDIAENLSVPNPHTAVQPTEPQKLDLTKIWPIPPTALTTQQAKAQTIDAPQQWTSDIERISQIKQKRRMRSNEIHYIDHPLYGMILEIRSDNSAAESSQVVTE